MSKFNLPPNRVVIQIQDKNTVEMGNLELQIVTKFLPEQWAVNEGILVDFSSVLAGDNIRIGGCMKHSSYFQKTLEKLKIGSRVFFHSNDVLAAIKNRDRTTSGNAFMIGDKKYFILPIDKLFAIERQGEIVALNDMAFVKPILTEEPMSKSGLLYLPSSNLPKYVKMKGMYNGEVVYMSEWRQKKLHKIEGEEYYIMHESEITAVENEEGEIEPTNNIIFIKPKRLNKVSSIILPEAFKAELQKVARGTELWVGEIVKASKMATLILRESGIKRVIGSEVYISGGFHLEMEVDGETIYAITVRGITQDNIVAYTENKESTKEVVYDNNDSHIQV